MKRIRIAGMSLILVLMLQVACAPAAPPAPAPAAGAPAKAAPEVAPAPAPAAGAPAKAVWEVVWESTVKAAQKEGTVIVGTAGGSRWRASLLEGFNDIYGRTYGLKLEAMTIRPAEFYPKISAERRIGVYIWDNFVGGGTVVVTGLKPLGVLDMLDPLLVLADLTNPQLIKQVWFGGKLGWVDRDHKGLMGLGFPMTPISINTNLVKEGEIKSLRDLLDPKWKGKIIFDDPTLTGPAGSDLLPMIVLGGVGGGVDWLRQIVKQDIIVMRDRRLAIEWLAHGKAAILAGTQQDIVWDFIEAGAPLKNFAPQEGVTLAGSFGGVTAINRSPHPNLSKVFVNWFLSKEGQTSLSKGINGQSLRLDVPTEGLPPDRIRQPGTNYYIKELEENLLRAPEVEKIAKEIFGPLMKK